MNNLNSIAKMQIVLYSLVERGEVSKDDFKLIHKYLEMAKEEQFDGGKSSRNLERLQA